MTRQKILEQWIDSANTGHIKDGIRELTPDELALIQRILLCIAGDFEIATPEENQ
jgi:hypothetical protein